MFYSSEKHLKGLSKDMTLNLIALDLLIQRMHENYYVQYYAKSEDNFKMAANFK
jgi:hypothetical protein